MQQQESMLATVPNTWEIGTPERIPLGIDYTNRLVASETIVSVALVSMIDVQTQLPVPAGVLDGPASISGGNILIQWIVAAGNGSPNGGLRPGKAQYLLVTAAVVSTGRTEATVTVVDVLF